MATNVLTLSTSTKNDLLTALLAKLNAGSGAAKLKLYTGTKRATPETSLTSQVLLGTLTCSDPAGSISSGVLTFGTVTQDSSADATGVASWASFTDSDDTPIADGDVTVTGGGGAVQLNSVNITSGGPILCTSAVIMF